MKRFIKYLSVSLIILACVYGFRLWLQYKWATVIKKTTTSILAELAKIDKLETASKTYTETITWEQQIASLLPDIGIDHIISSALFKDRMTLDIQGIVSAWYQLATVNSWSLRVSRDGTVTILLWAPQIFWVTLTWTTKAEQLGIVTQIDKDMEQQLRSKAGEMMIQQALSWGILDEAKNNAQHLLQTLLLKSWIQIKEVIVQASEQIK